MTVTAVVGAQWGDEGKGRIIDALAEEAVWVIRFQGGDNAGHTVINHYGEFKLHLVPSGIFHSKTNCLIGTGCVVNPATLLEEIETLEAAGVSTKRLYISERAQLVMPYHQLLDSSQESSSDKLGTTKRGIGPAYSDKAARRGLCVGDLRHLDWLEARLDQAVKFANSQLAYFQQKPVDPGEIYRLCLDWREKLQDRMIDPLPVIRA